MFISFEFSKFRNKFDRKLKLIVDLPDFTKSDLKPLHKLPVSGFSIFYFYGNLKNPENFNEIL